VRWFAIGHNPMWDTLPESVTVHSATNAAGQRIHVIHNWSWTPAQLSLPQDMTDILAESDAPTREVELGSWDVRILAE
jgi:beta-galactosidase